MKLSIFLMGTKGGSYFDVVDQVVEADALGFAGVWLAERHFASGDLLWPSPMVVAAYLAAYTRRIRIGLAARVLPFDHPLHVGADAATLDVLSEGRLDLGISRGSMDDEPHRAFAAPRDEARLRFDEALAVLRLFLRGRPFSHQGRFYQLDDIVPSPVSVQTPHPPLYVVANNPLSLDAAAAQGLPVFMNATLRPVDLDRALSRYRAGRAAAGFDPDAADVPVNRFVFVGETRAHAHRVMRGPFQEFLDRRAPDLKANLLGRFGERGLGFDFLAREICIFDDAEGCAARLARLAEQSNVRHALCTFNLITLDHRLAVESMRRFAREVAPRLARGVPSSRKAPESRIRAAGGARDAEAELVLRAG
jgi:alkanesulfonate monooxygenase SsuD/methylene tetrahydromethanopterin reductase-like flavin-dependent oxidoreductase (luciferase family)